MQKNSFSFCLVRYGFSVQNHFISPLNKFTEAGLLTLFSVFEDFNKYPKNKGLELFSLKMVEHVCI